jgi:cytochrome c
MKRMGLVAVGVTLSPGVMAARRDLSAAEPTQAPDITKVGDDPYGRLVKHGYTLFANTANEIGPRVPYPAKRFAGNNLACQNCHLRAGTQPFAMPLTSIWGSSDSYNNGAGMSRILTVAAYAMHNMPIGTVFNAPVLTDEQAYDVAAYIISHKRPEKKNLDKDFPIRLEKPIDTPYGPYADGFTLEQHKFGPFGSIRAKVQELAVESRIAEAGGPDNGSDQSNLKR